MHGKACCHINVPTPDMSLIFLVTSRVPHIQDIPSYHHPRNINADQTMKIIPFSPIGLFSVFWLLLFDFLIKKTMYLPTWHPPAIILLTLHTFCKGKELDSASMAWLVAKAELPEQLWCFHSLWILVKPRYSVFRILEWRNLSLNVKPSFTF